MQYGVVGLNIVGQDGLRVNVLFLQWDPTAQTTYSPAPFASTSNLIQCGSECQIGKQEVLEVKNNVTYASLPRAGLYVFFPHPAGVSV